MKFYRKSMTILTGTLTLMAVATSGKAVAANGGVVYTYDALGRVTSASYDTGVIIIYTYDANGNRTAQTVNANNPGTASNWNSFSWGAAAWHS